MITKHDNDQIDILKQQKKPAEIFRAILGCYLICKNIVAYLSDIQIDTSS